MLEKHTYTLDMAQKRTFLAQCACH